MIHFRLNYVQIMIPRGGLNHNIYQIFLKKCKEKKIFLVNFNWLGKLKFMWKKWRFQVCLYHDPFDLEWATIKRRGKKSWIFFSRLEKYLWQSFSKNQIVSKNCYLSKSVTRLCEHSSVEDRVIDGREKPQ